MASCYIQFTQVDFIAQGLLRRSLPPCGNPHTGPLSPREGGALFRWLPLAEIEAEDLTLSIARFVLSPVAKDIPPLPETVARRNWQAGYLRQ